MLILTRKTEQGIVIGGVITIRILSIDGDRVKIGIDAPDSVIVLREELLEQTASQNPPTTSSKTAPKGRSRRERRP